MRDAFGPKTEEILRKLKSKDEKAAYAFARELGEASAKADTYCGLIPAFASLLEEKSSYVRTRAFLLICDQARWDTEGRIASVFDRMRPLLCDEKPTVVRQCLGALRAVLLFRPELGPVIGDAVRAIDLSTYKESMALLIKKDIDALLKILS